MFALVSISDGALIALASSLPFNKRLPDGGRARFDAVGDERPAHDPVWRCVECVEATTPPDYPYVVTSETREFANGREEIGRAYAPDQAAYQRAIEEHVDAVAQSRGYSGAVSIATYVTSTNQAWALEAAAFIAWRDMVWAHAFEQLAAVQGGQMAPPTLGSFIAGLPAIEWPE